VAGRRTRWVAVATGLGYGGGDIGSLLSGFGRFLDRLKAEVSSSIQYRGGGLYPAILVFFPLILLTLLRLITFLMLIHACFLYQVHCLYK